jgi:hypothetical protein
VDAGWYPDPTGRNEHRYWDGSAWTDQVSTAGRQARDPVAATAPTAPTAPAAPPPAAAWSGPPPKKRRGCLPVALVLLGLLVLAGIGGGVVLVVSSGDDDDPVARDDTGRVAAPPADTAEPPESTDDAVGDVVEIDDGERARVNAVTPDAPPLDGSVTPEPGTSFTRLDVEQCAGDDELPTNPLYWSVQLDDGSMVEATIGAQGFETITLASGGCQRGDVVVSVPEERTVASVVLTNEILVETARWAVRPATPPETPLEPEEDPESEPLGEQVDALGGYAVAHAVGPGPAPGTEPLPPPAGTTLTSLDVEVCAGDEAVAVNPLYWFGVLDDSTILEAHLGGQTLQTLQLAAGQCERGSVEVAVPEGQEVAQVVFTGPTVVEVARWTVS